MLWYKDNIRKRCETVQIVFPKDINYLTAVSQSATAEAVLRFQLFPATKHLNIVCFSHSLKSAIFFLFYYPVQEQIQLKELGYKEMQRKIKQETLIGLKNAYPTVGCCFACSCAVELCF